MSVVDKIQLRRNGPFYDIRDNTKAPLDHTHDDRYYTESEVDSKESNIYDAINSKLPLSGGTVTGNLTVNSNIYGDVGHGIQTGGFIRQDIDPNSNLDAYTSPGFYKCTQNSIAVTLTNCPTGLAFTLDVVNSVGHSPDYTGYKYITQIVTSYFNDIFLRRGQGDYGGTITWQPWASMACQGNTFVARPSYESSIDQVYDASSFITTSNSSGTFPSGSGKYGAGLTIPYRKPYGNAKPDFAGQIWIPNGDAGQDNMYFRTSKASTWDTWQKVASVSVGSWTMQEVNGRISITSQQCSYYKIGQLVYVSIAAWISSGTSSETACFTLPFPINSNFPRNYGTVGYFPASSNYPNLHTIAANNDRTFFVFEYGNSSAVDQIKCNQLRSAFQCSMVYVTD